MRVAYIGIDLLYPALPALLDADCEIIKIFTCKTDQVTEFNSKVCAFAKEHNIVLQTERITRDDIEELQRLKCELVVCAAYYYRIPISKTIPMINIHPSLLPEGRGAWPMPVTILRGLTSSGVTFHKMTEHFDDGEILLQETVSVEQNETLESLTAKQCSKIPDMIKRLISEFEILYQQAIPQTGGSYWDCPNERDYVIDRTMSVKEADLILRAFYGYECRYREQNKEFVFLRGIAIKKEDKTNKYKDEFIARQKRLVHNTEMWCKHFLLKDGYIRVENVIRIEETDENSSHYGANHL